MPSAFVPVAAKGLPKSSQGASAEQATFDFHLHLCHLIAGVVSEEAELQRLFDGTADTLAHRRIERAMDDTMDRRNALMMALSGVQARSLGAAAVQMAAACGLLSSMTASHDVDLEAERAIERLVHSAALFMAPNAEFTDTEMVGVEAMFQPQISRWDALKRERSRAELADKSR